MDCYQELANAIIKQAATDYRAALKALKKNPENIIAQREADDVRRFFRSQWFCVLTDIDGEWLLEQLDKE